MIQTRFKKSVLLQIIFRALLIILYIIISTLFIIVIQIRPY